MTIFYPVEKTALKVRQLLQRAIRQSRVGLGMSGGLSQLIDNICETLRAWNVIDPLILPRLKVVIDKEESSFLNKSMQMRNRLMLSLKKEVQRIKN